MSVIHHAHWSSTLSSFSAPNSSTPRTAGDVTTGGPRLTLVGAEHVGGVAGSPIAPDPKPLLDPRARWLIDPDICFLNHGSYGAVMGDVLDAQVRIRERMEREPVRFFKVDLEGLVDRARARLAEFISCRPEDIAPVRNATVGLCTIFNNYPWRAGDEIVITDHEYSSGQHELERIAASKGIRVVVAHVPFPAYSAGEVLEAVAAGITERTRMVMVSHVTSCSSLIFPVAGVSELCRRRGIDLLIDGAHAPGQVPVDIAALDPAFYVGSLHKWLGAPRGASFIYVRRDLRDGFRTVALSSRAKKVRPERDLFLRDFDYMGTDDYSAFLVVPEAIDAGAGLVEGGWPALMDRNHRAVLEGRGILCAQAGLGRSCPDEMTGSMASLVLPEASPRLQGRTTRYDDPLQDVLLASHRIQVPIWRLWENPGVRVVRISAQVYNTQEQFAYLAAALRAELAAERVG